MNDIIKELMTAMLESQRNIKRAALKVALKYDVDEIVLIKILDAEIVEIESQLKELKS